MQALEGTRPSPLQKRPQTTRSIFDIDVDETELEGSGVELQDSELEALGLGLARDETTNAVVLSALTTTPSAEIIEAATVPNFQPDTQIPKSEVTSTFSNSSSEASDNTGRESNLTSSRADIGRVTFFYFLALFRKILVSQKGRFN